MSEHNYSERRECGCRITLVEDCGELEEIILEYCPKHGAADAMYDALRKLKNPSYDPGRGSGAHRIRFWKAMEEAAEALALADGSDRKDGG